MKIVEWWKSVRAASRVRKAKRIIRRVDNAFKRAAFDFLISRGWIPMGDRAGIWTRTLPNKTTINCSFRDALQRTLM